MEESEIITASPIQPDKRHVVSGGGGGGVFPPRRGGGDIESHDFETDSLGAKRIYKKTSPNALVTLYLGTREIVSKRGVVGPLRGVLFVDPKYVVGHRLFCQLTLTFRYGREDEEVMGLKFCNEAVIAIHQIWPRTEDVVHDLSPLQEALLERLGVGAHAFSIEVGIVAPPSVQLIPAKQYSGAPIGTSYDIRAYIADQADEKVQRRSTVKLGIRLVHRIPPEVRCLPSQTITNVSSLPKCLRLKLSPKAIKFSNKLCGAKTNGSRFTDCSADANGSVECGEDGSQAPPQGCVDKPFLWTDGKVSLRAALNKTAYSHDEAVSITVDVYNNSRKIIRKIRVCAVQHVDVCMFSNGKFKNIVAEMNIAEPLGPETRFNQTFELRPVRTPTKNWIAVEGALFNSSATEAIGNFPENTRLAPSSPPELKATEDRNVFAIYVSYYVKVKLTLSGMGGEVSLKLPFLLGHVDDDSAMEGVMVERRTDMKALESSDGCCEGAGACVGVVSSRSPRVVVETQCEVISELCEMSLSNNNVSSTITSSNQRTTVDEDIATCPSDGPSAAVSSNSTPRGEVSPLGRLNTNNNNDDGNAVEANNGQNPVISVATTVQVHVSNGSNHCRESRSITTTMETTGVATTPTNMKEESKEAKDEKNGIEDEAEVVLE